MKTKHSRGFTLVEVMVALAIGALLLSGIVQVFISLKRTDRVALALSRVQEAGRTAVDTLAYDFRMIGYKGCADPAIVENINIIANNPPTTNFIQTSLRGFDVTANNWSAGTELTTIDGATAKTARLNSDVISIMRASEISSGVDDHENNNANIFVLTNPLGLTQGDVAIISDCDNMDIFRITNVTASGGKIVFAHSNSNNSGNNLSKQYTDENAKLMTFISNTYFVGDTGRKNSNGDIIYALYRRDLKGTVDEIVEGVENVQITYGHTFVNGNRRFISASTSGLDMTQVTSIKFSVLVSSNDRVLENTDSFVYPMSGANAQPASSGGAITYADDRRLRKVFNMTVNLRNRRVSI